MLFITVGVLFDITTSNTIIVIVRVVGRALCTHIAEAGDLDNRVCGQLAAEVDMQVRLIEGFDGNGLGVLPCHHLEHHLMAPHMRQLLHCVGGLDPDLQQFLSCLVSLFLCLPSHGVVAMRGKVANLQALSFPILCVDM